jgi:hypothetical protein
VETKESNLEEDCYGKVKQGLKNPHPTLAYKNDQIYCLTPFTQLASLL